MIDINDDSPPNEAFEPIREQVKVDVGAFVRRREDTYRIVQVLDFETVIGIDVTSGRSTSLRIGDLRPISAKMSSTAASNPDLLDIADEDWHIAEKRFSAIKPLIDKYTVGREEAEIRAREVGVNTATLYRWLRRYKACGVVTALIPKKRGWREGKNRIPPESEKIIQEVIDDFYLTPQRPAIQKTVVEVKRRCYQKGIKVPGKTAIRTRIANISEKRRLRGRGYREKAKNKFMPTAGSFPNADFPLSVVQIDHTPVDIILVDDAHRKPIGRPWITLAIDVYSRMVTGYYLSFDPPSETSVAICVAHAILPKEEWLLLHKVDAKWPVWGVPRTIHVDNGSEFRSNNFQQSCLTHGIHLEFRPVRQPQYGGHIERLLGTFLKEIHDLPGTTFSSVKDRDGYDAEKHAAMTKSEFEAWLVTLICKVYHRRLHSSIEMTPLRQWEIGIFGSEDIPGVGVMPRPADKLTILLDFLPAFRRTVQTFGVTIDSMTYYAEALRPWINAVDPDTGKKQVFIFRRDPRDISTLWFFDPTLKQYYKIPFADQSLPAMSLWEYRQAREKLKREGAAGVDEHQILRAVTELRSKVEAASQKTKKARRMAQRRKEHAKKVSPAEPLAIKSKTPAEPPPDRLSELTAEEIENFGDIA